MMLAIMILANVLLLAAGSLIVTWLSGGLAHRRVESSHSRNGRG